jgi:hypothetical protein
MLNITAPCTRVSSILKILTRKHRITNTVLVRYTKACPDAWSWKDKRRVETQQKRFLTPIDECRTTLRDQMRSEPIGEQFDAANVLEHTEKCRRQQSAHVDKNGI